MYLPNDNKYVEIKGWWREDGKLKFNLAISDNPTLTFEVWDKDKLDSLKIPIRKIPST